MRRSETALVLAKIAAFDNRRLDPPDAADTPLLNAWHEVIGDLGVTEALAAVAAHYRDSRDWLMPAHLRQRVVQARTARLAAAPGVAELMADVHPDTPGYQQLYQARRGAIAAGATVERARILVPAPSVPAALLRFEPTGGDQ